MFTFGRKKFATASANGSHSLQLKAPDGRQTVVDLRELRSVGFVQVGDDTTVVYEGWWVLEFESEAIAIHLDCLPIDALLREPPLRSLLDSLSQKTLVFTANRPTCLNARGGVASFSIEEARQLLRSGTHQSVASVDDFPMMP